MNYTKRFECGCEIHAVLEGKIIIGSDIHQCPKHKAAPALYEACIHALAIIASLPDETATFKELSEALAKAGK